MFLPMQQGGAYSTSGLSYTNCSYNAGGYARMGNLVLINIRVKITANTGEATISGFPAHTTLGAAVQTNSPVIVSGQTGISITANLYNAGTIHMPANSTSYNNDVIINMMYFCD